MRRLLVVTLLTITVFNTAVGTINKAEAKQIHEIKEHELSLREIRTENLSADAISVSCLKVTWDADEKCNYEISYSTDADWTENICLLFKENGVCYITGLRENSSYDITVTPVLKKPNRYITVIPETVTGKTEKVRVLKTYEREEGKTNFFAGESETGLTLIPSSEAIAGTIEDPITETGIKRNRYGDYCCAMGLFYGEVGDRFLVELENGIQFTTVICDSKGMADDADGDGIPDGRFHWFGEDGKCIVEFIHEGNELPSEVAVTGTWSCKNWNGLNLDSEILSIKKISYGSEVQY